MRKKQQKQLKNLDSILNDLFVAEVNILIYYKIATDPYYYDYESAKNHIQDLYNNNKLEFNRLLVYAKQKAKEEQAINKKKEREKMKTTNDLLTEICSAICPDLMFAELDFNNQKYFVYADLLLENIKILNSQHNRVIFEKMIFPKEMDKEKLVGFAKFLITKDNNENK